MCAEGLKGRLGVQADLAAEVGQKEEGEQATMATAELEQFVQVRRGSALVDLWRLTSCTTN